MFGRGEIDLYATNKPTLFEMSDQMPGAKILDGNWGAEHMAIAIPKGREDALPLLNRFVTEEQSVRRAGHDPAAGGPARRVQGDARVARGLG